jgi:hypothetical protein
VAGWEEILFDAGAATNATIVNAWSRHRPPEITATGRRAVESYSAHFYFTEAAPGGPDGWCARHPRPRSATRTSDGIRAHGDGSRAHPINLPVRALPCGRHNVWYDIGTGVPPTERHLLLGGEMSMWSDTYCDTAQARHFTTGMTVCVRCCVPH